MPDILRDAGGHPGSTRRLAIIAPTTHHSEENTHVSQQVFRGGGALVLLAALSLPVSALAQSPAGDGGYWFASFSHAELEQEGFGLTLESDDGYILGGGRGFRLNRFRVELELALGRISDGRACLPPVCLDYESDTDFLSFTAAGYYDFIAQGPTPFVGAGAGIVHSDTDEVTILDTTVEGGDETDLAYFLEAGFSVPFGRDLEGALSYRWMRLDDEVDSEFNIIRASLRFH